MGSVQQEDNLKRGPQPTCLCGECKKCQDRAAQQRYYAKLKRLGLKKGQRLADAK